MVHYIYKIHFRGLNSEDFRKSDSMFYIYIGILKIQPTLTHFKRNVNVKYTVYIFSEPCDLI